MLKEEQITAASTVHSNTLSKGLSCLASGSIDAILLDLGLPDSQGLSTFEKIYAAAKAPIIILTGLDDDKQGLEAVRRGAQDYLIKGKLDGALLVKAITYAIERKKLDEAIKRQAELIDLSPDAIIIKKPDDTITFWSLGAEKLYGYTKAEAIGQKTCTLLKSKAFHSFKAIEAELKQKGNWSGELTQHTKLGQSKAIQSYWLAKCNADKEVVEIFESNVDITERKNAERLATIGATAGMVGHDIRNPLQVIETELYFARRSMTKLPQDKEAQKVLESIDVIQAQVDYIGKIVSDLQDYARPLKPEFKVVDLSELIGSTLFAIKVPDATVLTVDVEGSLKLNIDPIFVRRALTNLINNAIQAMPEGGKLVIKATQQEKQATITVEDTGKGIPEEAKAKLFTPLFTTKSKGQGFGLAVTKRLLEALNGTISFESQAGKGTKFIIRLPKP